jgi:ABC-2 type transport system ATP-binding protein
LLLMRSASVLRGERFRPVGSNGAGKTMLIEMIQSLRTPDSGSISLLGFNPTREADNLQEKIGIQLQTSTKQVLNSIWETLTLPLGCVKLATSEVE